MRSSCPWPLASIFMRSRALDTGAMVCYHGQVMTDQNTILIAAVIGGDINAVNAAIAAGADVHHHSGLALRHAAAEGHAEVVRRLLAAGADVHAQDDVALRYAAANDHAETVSLLLAAGANVHAKHEDALRHAAVNGHAEVVQRLLVAGADVHAADDAAIEQAACHGHADVVRMLLAAGADPLIAWRGAAIEVRSAVAKTLDACGDALTTKQRRNLITASESGEFVGLRAAAASMSRCKAIKRGPPTKNRRR